MVGLVYPGWIASEERKIKTNNGLTTRLKNVFYFLQIFWKKRKSFRFCQKPLVEFWRGGVAKVLLFLVNGNIKEKIVNSTQNIDALIFIRILSAKSMKTGR